MGGSAGGCSAPQRNTETTSVVVLLCRCSVLLSHAFLVVLVAFVAFSVLVARFVYAAIVVCAASAVLHVVCS